MKIANHNKTSRAVFSDLGSNYADKSARKKGFYLHERSGPIRVASYWHSGSRDYYIVYNMRTGARHIPDGGSYPTFNGAYILSPGEIIIGSGWWGTKAATGAIYYRPEDRHQVMTLLGNPEIGE
jgi:hypothetical protein